MTGKVIIFCYFLFKSYNFLKDIKVVQREWGWVRFFLYVWPAPVPKLLKIKGNSRACTEPDLQHRIVILFQSWILDEKNKVFNQIQTSNTHSIKDPTTLTTVSYCYYSCKLTVVKYSAKVIISAGLPLPLPTAAVV